MSMYRYETGEPGELELGELGETGELGEASDQEQLLGDALGGGLHSPLSEAQELELAGELLEVGSDQELEQFLGNIFKGVAKAVGGAIRSPLGQALGGVLKNVAKTALPAVGGALGSFVAPGIGTAIGSKLGSMASGLFELESEAEGAEQAEFEVARRVVRLSASAAQKAATAPAHLPPSQVAHAAVVQAARQVVPSALPARAAHAVATVPERPSARLAAGIVSPGGNGEGVPYGLGAQRTGRWIRRGRKIILLGA